MRGSFPLVAVASAAIFGTVSAALAEVDTDITASANGWDMRTEGYGCFPSGCIAENTLDASIEPDSRWSCNAEVSGVDACELTLTFDEPQNIKEVRIALWKGDQRTRAINLWVDGQLIGMIESSGTTESYETYELTALQATTILLQAASVQDNGWLSITGVLFMVDSELDVFPPSPAPTSDDFVGCFNDMIGDRIMTSVMTSEDLTPESCAATCAGMGDYFYGLQQGNECWCAGCDLTDYETNTDYDRYGEGSCLVPCAGDSTSTCGGDMAISLYRSGNCAFEGVDVSAAIATQIKADAVGGFAGPGYIMLDGSAYPVLLSEDDAGTAELSGTFAREDEAALPASTVLFLYVEGIEPDSDFVRGQGDIDISTGTFTATVTDIPAGFGSIILSFVVLDPADTATNQAMDSVFPLEVTNNACPGPLRITLEWNTADTDLDLYVTEPGGTEVYFGNRQGGVGYLDQDVVSGFGPENYRVVNGLSDNGDAALGGYTAHVRLAGADVDTIWTLTAYINNEVVWVEQGEFEASVYSTHSSASSSDAQRRRRLSTSTGSISSPGTSETFSVKLATYTEVEC